MKFESFEFGSLVIDGTEFDYDVIIDRGDIAKRQKKASKKYRAEFDHTPLSLAEKLPWKCRRLVVGTGAHGLLPVMDEVREEAGRRGVELLALPTKEAIRELRKRPAGTNAVLHVTC
ncbi:MAG: hypothetical protein E6I08_10385 [Chloroflexi bacterium]|nr:MAG: hypothetical protein E6I08_10385 [Chloroflexota bacterium]